MLLFLKIWFVDYIIKARYYQVVKCKVINWDLVKIPPTDEGGIFLLIFCHQYASVSAAYVERVVFFAAVFVGVVKASCIKNIAFV